MSSVTNASRIWLPAGFGRPVRGPKPKPAAAERENGASGLTLKVVMTLIYREALTFQPGKPSPGARYRADPVPAPETAGGHVPRHPRIHRADAACAPERAGPHPGALRRLPGASGPSAGRWRLNHGMCQRISNLADPKMN